MTKTQVAGASPGRSIRWKLAVAFVAVACLVAAFVGVAISVQFNAVERAARLEGEHVAELIADAAIENGSFRPRLQEYILHLNSLRPRDLVVVDARKKGIADVNLQELGGTFSDDRGDEVGKTIADGRTRTFFEKSEDQPNGAHQIVVAVHTSASKPGSPVLGAVILEYTSIREALFAAERTGLYFVIAIGILVVLLVTIFGLGFARRIADPLRQLQTSVKRIAALDYTARVAVTSRDEVGLLGTAFNKMAEDLSVSNAALVAHQSALEGRVVQRTLELNQSNASLQQEARERRLADERVEYLASFDVLTGLANRSLFLERVAQHVESASSGGYRLAVYQIDLERFKNINDSLGRPAGDALLKQVADWLTRVLGDANLLARVGADHFAAVLPEILEDGDAALFLGKITGAFLGHRFRLDDAVFRIAAKIGVSVFPDDGADADTLFRNAEAALKSAKASGDRILFFAQEMTAAAAGRLSLENQLREALERQEFVLHYQPKVNLASGKLSGAEALVRWNNPRTGLVPPDQFIPILEETGLILEVGRWALRRAVEDCARWRAASLPAVRISVNVSTLQLRDRGFIDEIRQMVRANAAAGLELEITESLIMEDVQHSIASMKAIRAMGVTIAIDDFGTGFSSLSYLSRLPVDTLKIDRSFMVDMTATPEGLALVSTFISLAHSLKLKVVAEGVENDDQLRLLRLLNCDEVQGTFFSAPMPAAIFETRFLAVPLAA